MEIPFSNQYGWIIPDPDLLDSLLVAGSDDERQKIFLDYLAFDPVASPYEFYGLMFNCDVCNYPIDVRRLTLDYIVDSKDIWDPDQVACFLLEVAEDHSSFIDDPSWLIKVDLPEMLELDYAGTMIWEMFWQGHDHLIMKLINHYHWNNVFAKQLDDSRQSIDPQQNPDDYYHYYALARIIEAGELDGPVDLSSATDLAEGLRAKEEGRFYDAISILLEFHEEFPNVMPQKVRTTLAICYLETGWRGLALEWVMRALKHDADNLEIQELQAQILAGDKEQLQRLEKELEGQFHVLAPESLQALTLAEFLYRYHGRMLHDHAPVISGYARAVETQLTQRLLPRVRKWIQAHGAENKHGRRWIRVGDHRLYEDVQDNQVTLGRWSSLFNEERPQDYKHASGEFYHCIHKVYGGSISFGQLAEFGKLLAELTDLRNLASHEVVNDWAKVRRAREILFVEELFNLLSSTTGSMFAS